VQACCGDCQQHTGYSGGQPGKRETEHEWQTKLLLIDHIRITADRQKSGMPKRGLTGLADEDHQPHSGQCPDQHIGEFADQIITDQEWQYQHDGKQKRVPEQLKAMLEQPDIIIIRGFE